MRQNAPCRVVFTIEGRTIVDYRVVAVAGAFQVVELPVTERWLPNAYLQACVANAPSADVAVKQLESVADAAAIEDEDASADPRWL